MKNYYLILIFIFLINCSFDKIESGVSRDNISKNVIDFPGEYSFDEYVNLLLNKSRSNVYPDINNIPD